MIHLVAIRFISRDAHTHTPVLGVGRRVGQVRRWAWREKPHQDVKGVGWVACNARNRISPVPRPSLPIPQEVPRNSEVGHGSSVRAQCCFFAPSQTKDAGGEREEERGYTSVKG